jgi:hypothetical protein
MKPTRSILDKRFRYVPSVATSVEDTWRRFGWKPREKAQPESARAATKSLPIDAGKYSRLSASEQRRLVSRYLDALSGATGVCVM